MKALRVRRARQNAIVSSKYGKNLMVRGRVWLCFAKQPVNFAYENPAKVKPPQAVCALPDDDETSLAKPGRHLFVDIISRDDKATFGRSKQSLRTTFICFKMESLDSLRSSLSKRKNPMNDWVDGPTSALKVYIMVVCV